VDEVKCLAAHNAKRALHQQTSPLIWSDTLARHAKAWADHLVETGVVGHDPNLNDEGENIYLINSTNPKAKSCEDAVDFW